MISNLTVGENSLVHENYIVQRDNFIKIDYPCDSHDSCTYVSFTIHPGVYNMSLYGASGSIIPNNNYIADGLYPDEDHISAGGFVSGILRIANPTVLFVHIGGRGSENQKKKRTEVIMVVVVARIIINTTQEEVQQMFVQM